MRLIGGRPRAGQPGTVHLLPQTAEDLFHAYNLIAPGDEVRSVSYRKIQKESSTGSSVAEKVGVVVTTGEREVRVKLIALGGDDDGDPNAMVWT